MNLSYIPKEAVPGELRKVSELESCPGWSSFLSYINNQKKELEEAVFRGDGVNDETLKALRNMLADLAQFPDNFKKECVSSEQDINIVSVSMAEENDPY